MGREQPHPGSADTDLPILRYERRLPVGSIGTLWLGRLVAGSEAGRTVLLRRLPMDALQSKDIESLRRIAEAYAKVRHPSLVKLLGLAEQDSDIISISEHLDGVRLNDLMRAAIDKDSPLPATVAVRIALDAARATLKAHRLATELGLFPSERLFIAEGVFVASFGGTLLAEVGVLSALSRFAYPRTIPDVLAQLAPEELTRGPESKGSPEVFSLGVLLWEMLANRQLFCRDNAQLTTEQVHNLPIEPLDHVERCGMPVPDALAEIVRRATNRHANQRYLTVEEFATALEQLPPHFIATEHHVAAALREQAAELLKDFHVETDNTSLTLAFSEMPASRLSTRPPPADGHNWEPPTFAQRRLVSSQALPRFTDITESGRPISVPPISSDLPTRAETASLGFGPVAPRAMQAAAAGISLLPIELREPAPPTSMDVASARVSPLQLAQATSLGVGPVASLDAEESLLLESADGAAAPARNLLLQRVLWVTLAVAIVVSFLAVAWWLWPNPLPSAKTSPEQPVTTPVARPEARGVSGPSQPSADTSVPSSKAEQPAEGTATNDREPPGPERPATSGPIPIPNQKSVAPEGAAPRTSTPSSKTKPSGATYRPRQIEPYHPKGI